MFFTLSKIVGFLVQPSSLIALAFCAGFGLLVRGRVVAARRWLAGGLAALAVAGFAPFGDLVTLPLENRFTRPDLAGIDVAGIIVLGGAEDARIPATRELMALNEAGERLTEAVALARRFPQARVVISGGSGVLIGDKGVEADAASRLLAALGIAGERITLESRSRNTRENALFTRAVLGGQPAGRWLLVTSAFHMPRAIGCFRAVGLDPTAWPVDYRTTGSLDLTHMYASLADGLRRSDTIAREYIGLLAYRLNGYTTALLPAP